MARACVALLIQCVHYLVHNSPSSSSSLPRPHYAHSVSAPLTSHDPSDAGVGVSGDSGGGEVEDTLLWVTLQKGLTNLHWINKFKTGLSIFYIADSM